MPTTRPATLMVVIFSAHSAESAVLAVAAVSSPMSMSKYGQRSFNIGAHLQDTVV